MALAAVIISIVAVMTSVILGQRALKLARHSNIMPVLIDLFREHRSDRLADARHFVYYDLPKCDVSLGIDGLPDDKKSLVRDLARFYDNLGALVTHGIIDIEPVSGYLGQSVLVYWERMQPLVQTERHKRQGQYDPERWQIYFENLYQLIREQPLKKLARPSVCGDSKNRSVRESPLVASAIAQTSLERRRSGRADVY